VSGRPPQQVDPCRPPGREDCGEHPRQRLHHDDARRRGEAPPDAPTPARHLPHVVAVGPALTEQDDAAEFEYGLELLLSGFASAVGAAPEPER
jgi:hypothetical protein